MGATASSPDGNDDDRDDNNNDDDNNDVAYYFQTTLGGRVRGRRVRPSGQSSAAAAASTTTTSAPPPPPASSTRSSVSATVGTGGGGRRRRSGISSSVRFAVDDDDHQGIEGGDGNSGVSIIPTEITILAVPKNGGGDGGGGGMVTASRVDSTDDSNSNAATSDGAYDGSVYLDLTNFTGRIRIDKGPGPEQLLQQQQQQQFRQRLDVNNFLLNPPSERLVPLTPTRIPIRMQDTNPRRPSSSVGSSPSSSSRRSLLRMNNDGSIRVTSPTAATATTPTGDDNDIEASAGLQQQQQQQRQFPSQYDHLSISMTQSIDSGGGSGSFRRHRRRRRRRHDDDDDSADSNSESEDDDDDDDDGTVTMIHPATPGGGGGGGGAFGNSITTTTPRPLSSNVSSSHDDDDAVTTSRYLSFIQVMGLHIRASGVDGVGGGTSSSTDRPNGRERPQGQQTPMHQLVSSPDLTVKKLQDMLDDKRRHGSGSSSSSSSSNKSSSTVWVRTRDDNGRLPLHVLGNNCQLLSTLEGQVIAKQCAMLLIESFPDAIVKTDNSNRVPFTSLIFGWVAWSHLSMELLDASHSSRTDRAGIGGGGLMTPTAMSGAIHHLQNLASKLTDWERQKASSNTNDGQSNSTTTTSDGKDAQLREELAEAARSTLALSQSSNKFPSVIIFEQVEWSFRMLSQAMDYLAGNTFDVAKRGRPALSYRKQRLNRDLLAQNLVSIPQLFKTVLLIESKDVREEITNSTAFRRAMLCKQSVGPWLTSMLRSRKGNSAEMALQYLESISNLTITDYVGEFRTPLPRDEALFHQAKIDVYDYIDEVNDVIPSLLVLREDLLNRAVALPLIWRLMNRRITTPFTVSLTVTDFLLHLTLILAVRDISFRTYNSDSQWLAGTAVIVFIAAYQILRRAVEIFVLARISKRVARRFFFNFYNLLDFIGIVGALVTVGLGADFSIAMLPAIILGLLWFRILGFLKVVNEQLATFIESLKKICYDIRFFLIVFLILIFTFGDMFHLFYLTSPSINCDELQDDVSNDFCADNSLYSYLRVYAVILGDFELSQFQLTDGVTFLWVGVTLLGTIILLNVLIAVVTKSYEESLGTSAIIFRKSRAEFVVSHVATEKFLHPRKDQAQGQPANDEMGGYSQGFDSNYSSTVIASRAKEAIKQIIFKWLLRWVVAIAFLLTISLSATYMVERIVYSARNEQATIIFLAFVGLVAFLLIYSAWAAIVLIISVLIQGCAPKSCMNSTVLRWMNKVSDVLITRTASFMFGIDASNLDHGGLLQSLGDDNNEEILNRMDKMESMLERTLEKLEEKDIKKIDAPPGDG